MLKKWRRKKIRKRKKNDSPMGRDKREREGQFSGSPPG